MKNKFSERLFICLFVSFALIFSAWLMFHTFGYSQNNILIGSKAWSDFSWTIPMIRSFSYGTNFPVVAPLFPGEPIHYHFLFYALVGLLEKMGVRIDWALNVPSVLGFTAVLVMLYLFTKKLFNSKAVGILTVLFFLFNGTLSFIYFFSQHPLSFWSIQDVIKSTSFSSFGPYDGKIVTAFWNLNIYTNQRHLAGAFALSLLLISLFLQPVFSKHGENSRYILLKSLVIGIILGCMFYFHLVVLLMTCISILIFTILFKKLRLSGIIVLTLCSLISLPQYMYLRSGGPSFKLMFHPGYLTANDLSFLNFAIHWVMNLGLHLFLIPIGFFLSSWKQRKIFLAFFASFIIGNLFQFSPDIAGNHKFFNYFMLVGSAFSAYALLRMWEWKILLRPFVVVLSFFLILSGIIDFFPVYNDTSMTIADYPINSDVSWIMQNTKPTDIFLNNSYLYDSASLAGRKIFLGWPYFSWSSGYDTNARGETMKEILQGTDKRTVCTLLLINHIDYVEIDPLENTNFDFPNPPTIFSPQQFSLVHANPAKNYSIYSVAKSCSAPQ